MSSTSDATPPGVLHTIIAYTVSAFLFPSPSPVQEEHRSGCFQILSSAGNSPEICPSGTWFLSSAGQCFLPSYRSPYIEVRPLAVYVFRLELPAVVVDGSLPDHGADRSSHFYHSFLSLPPQRAFVTFCESNAKALLTACGHQKVLLRSPSVRLPRLISLRSVFNQPD